LGHQPGQILCRHAPRRCARIGTRGAHPSCASSASIRFHLLLKSEKGGRPWPDATRGPFCPGGSAGYSAAQLIIDVDGRKPQCNPASIGQSAMNLLSPLRLPKRERLVDDLCRFLPYSLILIVAVSILFDADSTAQHSRGLLGRRRCDPADRFPADSAQAGRKRRPPRVPMSISFSSA